MTVYKNVLALSGGSVNGAFQAGAIAEVLKKIEPHAVFGVTVGCLNGLFLLNESGKEVLEKGKPDWPSIGEKMAQFWIDNIKGPESIVAKRKLLSIAWGILTKNFKGLADSKPMRDLIYRSVKKEYIMASPLHFAAAVMDVRTAELFYVDRSDPNFMEYLVASVTEPLMMPHVEIAGRMIVDAACRASSPAEEAARSGAERILAINSHPLKLHAVDFKPGEFGTAAKRYSGIITWSQMHGDMKIAKMIRELVALGQGTNPDSQAYQSVVKEIITLQPESLPGVDIQNFTSDHVAKMIDFGREFAKKNLQGLNW